MRIGLLIAVLCLINSSNATSPLVPNLPTISPTDSSKVREKLDESKGKQKAQKTKSITVRETCPECRGSKSTTNPITNKRSICGRCFGSGQVTVTKEVPDAF